MSTPKKRLAAISAAGVVFAVGGGGIAIATWQGSGNGNAFGKAASLGAPVTVSAAATTGSTSSSITISVTAGPGGSSATPSGYRVDRVSPAATGVCTISGVTGSCTDTGRTGSTTYNYKIYSLIGASLSSPSWVSSANATAGATTTAAPDTAAPVWTPACPTNAGNYTVVNNGSWQSACNSKLSGSAADATGVQKIEVSVQEGTGASACFDSAAPNHFDQACDNFIDITASLSSGSYSLGITRQQLTAGKTYTVKVRTTDTLGNIATMSYTFSATS